VALIALALGGGLLVWKTTQQSPPPAPPPVAQKPVAAPPPAFEAPPPPPVEPPPPELLPEPPPEPAKATTRRDSACEGECTGTETPELLSALGGKGGQARSCYERALTHNSSLTGKLVASVRVGPNGNVCTASASNDTLGDASVTNCVLSRFRSGKFPKPIGGCVDVNVPLSFVPASR
jgi:hypothetical protein